MALKTNLLENQYCTSKPCKGAISVATNIKRNIKPSSVGATCKSTEMPNTYTQIYIQIVFAVKGREHFIKEPFREELQKYMTGIVNNKKQKLYAIHCMPDHTHLFVSMKPDLSISDLTRDIKSNSSSFLKDKKFVPELFSWQTGFGAFSYSKSQAPDVVNYILNQPAHHKKKTFREEYLEFLEKFGIEYDSNYLFEFYD